MTTAYDFTNLSDEDLWNALCDAEDDMMWKAFSHGPGTEVYLESHRKLDALIEEDDARRKRKEAQAANALMKDIARLNEM